MAEANITSKGIRKALSEFNAERAIAEYISNGFDAGATTIDVKFNYSPFDGFTEFSIADNGSGINFNQLASKFQPILESEKAYKRKEENIGLMGKDGYGRLTFFKFARFAEWTTIFSQDEKLYSYNIKIGADSLNNYDPSEPYLLTTNAATGTIVTFNEFSDELTKSFVENKLSNFLKGEFSWFLELNKSKGFKIVLNGETLEHDAWIADSVFFPVEIPSEDKKSSFHFDCQFIQWNKKLNDEYSRFYFVNQDEKLKYQRTTKLNNKGDQFHHSVIVKSSFFDNFVYDEKEENSNSPKLFNFKEESRIFNKLINELNAYLRKKRKPFLQKYAETLIKTYEAEKVMPEFGKNKWDEVRKEEFETLVKELYEVEPALFVKLNNEQKKTFLHILNLVLDSDERESLFKILDKVIELDPLERQELEKILRTTKLSNIIKALRLVHDRLITLEKLKDLVFKHELNANEVNHLQKVVEEHYWIFGEEYNFVCSAEVKFEEALRRYLYILRGEDIKTKIDHPDKLKEVDIFVSGQDFRNGIINNLIIELKNPTTIKKLTNKQLLQLETYKSTILAIDEFNDTSCQWSFYLIGQDYDGEISEKIDSAKNHGQRNLVQQSKNYKMYVFKWSEIINDVEIRLRWLNEKLQIEREKLTTTSLTAAQILEDLQDNTAKADISNPILN